MRGDSGFTLVEVLVALVVSGFLLAIVVEGAMLGRERGDLAADKREAVLLAGTLIARAAAEPYDEGRRRGEEDGFGWELIEAPLMVEPRGRYVLAGIAARVSSAGGAALFEAETRRLKRTAAE